MHNYLIKLAKLHRDRPDMFPAGTLGDVGFYQDDPCAIFQGGECNCDPDLVVNTDSDEAARVKRMVDSAAKFATIIRSKRQ